MWAFSLNAPLINLQDKFITKNRTGQYSLRVREFIRRPASLKEICRALS